MNALKPSDAVLAIRCQLGDKGAWEELVQRWHPRLWGFVSRMILDRTTAEDVLQTIWLRVIRSLVRLRDPERFTAWIYQIARIAVADRLRDKYRQPVPEELGELSDPDAGIDQLVATDAVQHGLRELHPLDRETVILHYLKELPVAEVAEICGIPSGTVKSRLYRARRIMRRALSSEGTNNELS